MHFGQAQRRPSRTPLQVNTSVQVVGGQYERAGGALWGSGRPSVRWGSKMLGVLAYQGVELIEEGDLAVLDFLAGEVERKELGAVYFREFFELL